MYLPTVATGTGGYVLRVCRHASLQQQNLLLLGRPLGRKLQSHGVGARRLASFLDQSNRSRQCSEDGRRKITICLEDIRFAVLSKAQDQTARPVWVHLQLDKLS